jgi:hypothetical protein
MKYTLNDIVQQIKGLGGSESAELLDSFFRQFSESFNKDFDVDEILKSITSEYGEFRNRNSETSWGNIGSGGYNVIPTVPNGGVCSTICLTIVREGFSRTSMSFRNRIGFNKAMLLQAEYWFTCMHINKETLILTPDWSQVEFESRYQNLIESYCITHSKKVFIVEVSKVGLILRYPY